MSLDTTRHEKAIEGIVRFRVVIGLGVIGLCGCVSVPAPEPASPVLTPMEISDHVAFLSQYALQGRTSGSRGSALARRYIEQRFAACGLVPWGRARGYNQPILMGTNVIGVLPGSDPNLAKEFVILAAHYDHLGWTRRGLCLGACDNASGVAAMLEIAEALAFGRDRPRRSVCLAAFDCEEKMTVGSMAFTCRDDFDPNRIAGMVNLDMLGRHGFEVMDRSLFVVGTEAFPELRRRIRELAGDGLRILPMGTDLVGPRGDHVAFESMGVPTLFFTCSLYKDYHRPGDTADRLDYEDLHRSAQLACDTVRLLADRPGRYAPISPSHGDIEEVQALNLCLGRVLEHPERLNLTPKDCNSIQGLVQKTGRILEENDYSLDDRRLFLWWNAMETLAPLVERFEAPAAPRRPKPQDEKPLTIQRRALCFFSMEGRKVMVEAGQALLRHLSGYRHLLLTGTAPFHYSTSYLPDPFLSLTQHDGRQFVLAAVYIQGTLRYTQPPLLLWPLQSPGIVGTKAVWTGFVREGTREDLVDACLLDWGQDQDPNARREVWQKVLNRITGENRDRTFQEWLDWRLAQEPWPDQASWLRALARDRGRSGSWRVAQTSLWQISRKARIEAESLYSDLVADTSVHPCLRDTAIRSLSSKAGRSGLLALADAVGDPTPIPTLHDRSVKCPNPLLLELIKYLNADDKKWILPRALMRKAGPKKAPATLGELAQRRLEQLTGKDLGKDPVAWIQWIERHRR